MKTGPHISALKRLNLSLVVLTAIVLNFAYQNLDLRQKLQTSNILQFVMAAFGAATSQNTQPLRNADIVNVSLMAMTERLHEDIQDASNDWDASKPGAGPKPAPHVDPFNQELIEHATYLPNIRWPLNPGGRCSAAMFSGEAKKLQQLHQADAYPLVYSVPLSDIRLIIFSDNCKSQFYDVPSMLLITKEDGETAIGIPPRAYARFAEDRIEQPLWTVTFLPNVLKREDIVLAKSPLIEQFINDPLPSYSIMSERFFEDRVFQVAGNVTGTLRKPDDLEGALKDLSIGFTSKLASFEGISLASTLFLQVAPLIATALIYLFSHHLRLIMPHYLSSDDPWLLTDAKGIADRLAGTLASLVPVAATILIYGSFTVDNGLSLDMHPLRFNLPAYFHVPPAMDNSSSILPLYGAFLFVSFLYTMYLACRSTFSLNRILWNFC